MTEKLFYNTDVVLRFESGVWLASNPRLRTHVELDAEALVVLTTGAAGQEELVWVEALARTSGYDRTQRAVGVTGLHTDHSGVAETRGDARKGAALLKLLRQHRVLIASHNEAIDMVRPLSSVLDRESMGNFHQRVGQHLVWQRQHEPWRAWQNQKFTPDGLTLLDGAYLRIQAYHFDKYFTPERLKGRRILDFGCGNGYFSARMADAGADVLALDNSAELLALARHNHSQKADLHFIETGSFDEVMMLVDGLPANSFDYIYLQDTLLLLLQPESGPTSQQLPDVFRAFHRLLRPMGRLCAMEPNAIFWLANRYGDPLRRYAIVTEYFQPRFNVVPTLDHLIAFMAKAGFALYGYTHPRPEATLADIYQSEFPIWDFYVFVTLPEIAA